MANPIAFTDLDRLLQERGFVCSRPDPTHTLYTHPTNDTFLFLMPPWRPGDLVRPHHVVDVRKHLIEWGMIEEEEFERWLCNVRFGGGQRESAAVIAGDGNLTDRR